MTLRLLTPIGLVILLLASARELMAQAPAQPCKSTVTGKLEVISLESKVYGDKRLLRVWLPSGYSTATTLGKRYPVLYLFDGQLLFDRCTSQPFPDEWHVDEVLTELLAKRAVQPLIVVGIDNAGPGRREDEYSRYGAMADAPQKLSAFMTREILPLIDGRYRTIADRTHRGVGGSSLASVAALSLLLDQPDTFGLGLLESTSLQDGNGRVLQDTSTIVQGPSRVSIGVGTTEVPPAEAAAHGFPDFDPAFVAMSRTLAESMKKSLMNHPEVKLTVEPGGQHQPRYWGKRFGAAVTFLFPPEPGWVSGCVGVRCVADRRSRASRASRTCERQCGRKAGAPNRVHRRAKNRADFFSTAIDWHKRVPIHREVNSCRCFDLSSNGCDISEVKKAEADLGWPPAHSTLRNGSSNI